MTPKAEPRRRVGGACPVRVLVVEDFVAFRQFILSMLASMPDLRVIGEVSDGLDAVHKSAERQPDLVLLDIGLPRLKRDRSYATNPQACVPGAKNHLLDSRILPLMLCKRPLPWAGRATLSKQWPEASCSVPWRQSYQEGHLSVAVMTIDNSFTFPARRNTAIGQHYLPP